MNRRIYFTSTEFDVALSLAREFVSQASTYRAESLHQPIPPAAWKDVRLGGSLFALKQALANLAAGDLVTFIEGEGAEE